MTVGDAVVAAQVLVSEGSLDVPALARARSLLGLVVLALIAWAVGTRPSKIPWRVVWWGLGLQLAFALFILKTPLGADVFDAAGAVVVRLLDYTAHGARFVFGDLVEQTVPVGTGVVGQGGFTAMPGQVARTGATFAFSVLPTIIFFSALMTVLYHLGIMQLAVRGAAWVMQRTMGTSGAETLSAAGNIFVGQTEAPLLVKPFIEDMTDSELMVVMTGGFATVAGGVLAAYVGMMVAYFPDIAGHLIAASVMSAPAALVVSKLMLPETGRPTTSDLPGIVVESPDVNVIDAATRGASEGLQLALNVGAMVLAFVALIHLCNGMLGWLGGLGGYEGLTLESLLGGLLAPLAWLMGVPWADAPAVGSLMGVKTVLNEFVAYLQLAGMLEGGVPVAEGVASVAEGATAVVEGARAAAEGAQVGGLADGALQSGAPLQARSVVIATYALSGFANFGSIAIQIGGIGGIAPSRRQDLSRLGLRAMIGGSIAAFMTASVAGMIL